MSFQHFPFPTARHGFAAALFLLFPLFLFSQFPQGGAPNRGGGAGNGPGNIGRFYGKVIDEGTGKPLSYATVQLTAMRFDSASHSMKEVVVGGQLTEDNGDFTLENLPVRGEYTLKVNFLGYAAMEKKVSFGRPNGQKPGNGNEGQGGGASFDKDLGNIRLAASSQLLKEVTVQGEAAAFTLALDKKVYKVDQNGVAAGGTAEDALKNVPSLSVDIDGNVTMRNAAPQIFVDGRPTTLTIDQIPADAIDNVEVITNPSAKYDASGGGAGIVNIVLKKNRRVGYNGSVRAGIDSRAKFNLNGDLNAREGKFNAFISGNYNQRRNKGTGETFRQNLSGYPLTNVQQNTTTANDGLFTGGRAGIDWFVTNRTTLTLAANGNAGGFKPEDMLDIETDTLINALAHAGFSHRLSKNEREYRNFGGQFLFKHLFPRENEEWTADLNFNQSKSNNTGNFLTTYSGTNAESRQRQEGKGTNRFITAQSDFTTPLNAGMKLDAGIKAALRYYQSENANYQADSAGHSVQVVGFADRYKFDDQVFAAYGSFSHSFPKWGYQAGLRAESSYYTGTLLDTDSTFNNEYPLSLFPSAFLTYKLNEEDNLQLSYTRRINRPGFFQLIPFPDFSDSLLLSRGNPGLRPEFAQSFELSYQNVFAKGHNLLASVYYKRSTDLITRYQFTEFNEVIHRDVIVSSFVNANSSYAYGFEMTLKNTLWKVLDLTTNANFYNSVVDASNVEASLRNEQFTYLLKENLTLRLPWSFSFQANGEYQSRTAFSIDQGGGGRGPGGGGPGGPGGWGGGPSSSAQGYTLPNWFVDLSLKKDLWKRRGSITLSIQDIFASRRNASHSASAFFIQDSERRRDPQLVRVNFSYRFGKFDVSLFKRKNTRVSTEGMDSGF